MSTIAQAWPNILIGNNISVMPSLASVLFRLGQNYWAERSVQVKVLGTILRIMWNFSVDSSRWVLISQSACLLYYSS